MVRDARGLPAVTGRDEQQYSRFSSLGSTHHSVTAELLSAFEAGVKQLLTAQQQQQEQLGPPPLWQQALLLLVAQHAPALRSRCMPPRPGHPYERWAGGDPMPELHTNTLALLDGLQAGRSAQEVQDFISSRLLGSGQHRLLLDCDAAWGKHILHCALAHGAPELLAWSLQPWSWQYRVMWGANGGFVQRVVYESAIFSGLTPITCRGWAMPPHDSQPRGWYRLPRPQQQQDLVQVQQARKQLLGPAGAFSGGSSSTSSSGLLGCAAVPLLQFAQSAVQLALILLQHPAAAPNTLITWLRVPLGVCSTLPDLVRARAIIAAVAADQVMPPGAQVLQKSAVRQLLSVGDPDLWSVVLLWSHRLPEAG